MTPLSQYTPPRYSSHPRPLTPEENRAIDQQCITARYPDDGEERSCPTDRRPLSWDGSGK